MVNEMGALIAILGYGAAVGILGLYFASRERKRRAASAKMVAAENTSLAKMVVAAENEGLRTILEKTAAVHGLLRTDSGDEIEVYLQKTPR